MHKYTIEPGTPAITVDEYLKTILEISARNRQKMFHSGSVLVNGKKTFSKRMLKANDVLSVKIEKDKDYGVVPEEGTIQILYEDEQIIALNKPAGILVHPAGQTNNGTLANYLANYFKTKKQIITIRPLHRLDRDTSGIVLFAKNAEIQKKLTEDFANNKIHRQYTAIVKGKLEQEKGRIEAPIGKDKTNPNRRRITQNGQNAITNYNVIKTIENKGDHLSLIELKLETGRTHQIRIHMAHIGHAVLGDKMYGKASRQIKRQALHASAMTFINPLTKQNIKITAELPEDMFKITQK